MKRRTLQSAVLREDRKAFFSVGSSIFPAFTPFAAPVSEAAFLCSAQSAGSGDALGQPATPNQLTLHVSMQNNLTLVPQAATGAARQVAQECKKERASFGRDAADLPNLTFKRMTYADVVKLHSSVGVGIARVAQFSFSQKGIRGCLPFLINRNNVI